MTKATLEPRFLSSGIQSATYSVVVPIDKKEERACKEIGLKRIARKKIGKESACSAGDLGSIPGSGRSPGEGNGNPPQYSCLETPMDRRLMGSQRLAFDLGAKLSSTSWTNLTS